MDVITWITASECKKVLEDKRNEVNNIIPDEVFERIIFYLTKYDELKSQIKALKGGLTMDVKEIVKKYHDTCRRYQLSDEYLQEQKCNTRMEMPTAVEFRYGVVYLQDDAVDALIKRIEELEGRYDGHKNED